MRSKMPSSSWTGVGVKHGAAHGVGDGFQGVLAGGVAAAFVFHRPDDDGVEQRAGLDGGFAGGVEVGVAGGFAGVGDQDDDAAAIFAAALEGAGARAGWRRRERCRSRRACDVTAASKVGDVVGEAGELRDVFADGKHGEAIARAQNLANKMRGGFLFEGDLLVGAEAGVDHEREIEWLLRFGLEDVELLFDAFLENLKGFAREIRSGAIVLVEDAGEHADELDVYADFAALLLGRDFGVVVERIDGGDAGSRRLLLWLWCWNWTWTCAPRAVDRLCVAALRGSSLKMALRHKRNAKSAGWALVASGY